MVFANRVSSLMPKVTGQACQDSSSKAEHCCHWTDYGLNSWLHIPDFNLENCDMSYNVSLSQVICAHSWIYAYGRDIIQYGRYSQCDMYQFWRAQSGLRKVHRTQLHRAWVDVYLGTTSPSAVQDWVKCTKFLSAVRGGIASGQRYTICLRSFRQWDRHFGVFLDNLIISRHSLSRPWMAKQRHRYHNYSVNKPFVGTGQRASDSTWQATQKLFYMLQQGLGAIWLEIWLREKREHLR